VEALALFLRYGADPNVTDEMGMHILEHINTEKTFSQLELLLQYGADPLMWITHPGRKILIFTQLLLGSLPEAFSLKVLRVFIKHICQRTGIERMRAVFDTPILYDGRSFYPSIGLFISSAYPQYLKSIGKEQDAPDQMPFIQQLLRQLHSLLQANNPLLSAVTSGQLAAVQTRLVEGDITLAVLSQATKLAVEMGHSDMVTYMKGRMGALIEANRKKATTLTPTITPPVERKGASTESKSRAASLPGATPLLPSSREVRFIVDEANYCIMLEQVC